MKPDWKDAPEWADWLAMDDDGAWFWFEYEPDKIGEVWMKGGRSLSAGDSEPYIALEHRPD